MSTSDNVPAVSPSAAVAGKPALSLPQKAQPDIASHDDRAQLICAGRLEDARAALEQLRAELGRAPRWRPSRGLGAQCDEALALIADMRQRLKRKLVVVLVGPTGAGKSTLLNALAGVDDLSSSSVTRPTTREVVVFCRDRDDAKPIVDRLGGERTQVVSSPAAAALEHVILVDTPDINSADAAIHQPIVEAVLAQADVMLCVFNVENPKARSEADYLARFVAGFPSRFVVAVLNHCDRQDERELREDIRPDFARHLVTAWKRETTVMCISARRNLRVPAWSPGAEPRHDFDEFPALRALLFGSLNRASVVLDARIERADHLVAQVSTAVAARARATALDDVRGQVVQLHKEALGAAATAWSDGSQGLGVGTDALFYQRLANGWWGPVGWLIGLWARLLIVGAGFANMLRLGNPLRQLWGVVTTLARFKQARSDIDATQAGVGVDFAAMRYRDSYEHAWPELAERLIGAGFDPSLRDSSTVVVLPAELERTLAAGWNAALTQALERASTRLSSLWLQLFLNSWVLVPALYIVGESIVRFVQGDILSGDWFHHALTTLLLLWLLAFVVFQIGARALGGQRLVRAAFAGLLESVRGAPAIAREGSVVAEIDAVRRLTKH